MRSGSYVLCVTLNPVLDTTYFVDEMRPVYRTEAHAVTHTAGGKGNNVARALGLLGVEAHSLVALGGMVGRNVVEVWKNDPFTATAIWTDDETRLQITVIDGHGVQRAFYAPPAKFSKVDAERSETAFALLAGSASAICVCGSSPSAAADHLYGRFITMGRERHALTFLDSYGEPLRHGLRSRPDVVKVNVAEAEGFLGRKIEGGEAERQAVRELWAAGVEAAVLTLGARGSLLATRDGVWHAFPPQVQALNPIGSGDAMTAGMVAALLRGDPATEAVQWGMAAAAANTLTWEACRFDPDEVEQLHPMVQLEKVAAASDARHRKP